VFLAARRQALLFVVAVQFLTRLPTPKLPGYRADWLPQSVRYFPLVGVLVGLVNVAVWQLANLALPPVVSVGLMLAASLLTTGAFHEDGFADVCDGFGAGTSKNRVLEIMKDPRIGTYGAAGVFVVLGLKWATLAALPRLLFPLTVISAHMFSRWCAAGLMWRLRYVRVGDAKSGVFANSLSGGGWLASGAVGAIAVGAVAFFFGPSSGLFAARALVISAFSAAVTAVAAAAYFRRRIGGYTGDCLGAVQQLTELAFLLGGLAMLGPAKPAD